MAWDTILSQQYVEQKLQLGMKNTISMCMEWRRKKASLAKKSAQEVLDEYEDSKHQNYTKNLILVSDWNGANIFGVFEGYKTKLHKETRKSATFNLYSYNKPMAAISYHIVSDATGQTATATDLHEKGAVKRLPNYISSLDVVSTKEYGAISVS